MQAPPLQTECLVLTLKPPSVSPANAQRDNGTVREATKAQFSDSKPLTSTWRHAGRLQLMVTFVYRSAFLRSRHRRIAAPLPTRNIAQPKANASGGGRSALPGARGPALPSAPPQPRAPARSPLHPAAHGTAARPDAEASAVLTAPTKRRCRRARPGELRLRPSRSRPAAGFQPVPAQAGRRLSDSLASAESRLSSPLRAPPRSAGAPGRARAEDGGELSAGALRHSGPGRGPRPRPLPRLRPAGRGSADKGRGAGPGSPRAARPPPGPPPRRPPPPAPRRATRPSPPPPLLFPSPPLADSRWRGGGAYSGCPRGRSWWRQRRGRERGAEKRRLQRPRLPETRSPLRLAAGWKGAADWRGRRQSAAALFAPLLPLGPLPSRRPPLCSHYRRRERRRAAADWGGEDARGHPRSWPLLTIGLREAGSGRGGSGRGRGLGAGRPGGSGEWWRWGPGPEGVGGEASGACRGRNRRAGGRGW